MVHHPSQTPEVSSRRVLVNGLRENTLIKHAQVYIYISYIIKYIFLIKEQTPFAMEYGYYTEIEKKDGRNVVLPTHTLPAIFKIAKAAGLV